MSKKRPVYLNLLRIKMPMSAIVSFSHRLSGLLMSIAIPFCIYLLDKSLGGVTEYLEVLNLVSSTPVKVFILLLIWSLTLHLMAGIRFLLIDIDIGVSRSASTLTAWLVNLLGFALFLFIAGALL